ncbi:hypothetical protein HID58_068443 [Brassica napus]|uniref:Mic1 domain-containing protein n=2 Tax=Brassica TaxID=3705 RepID=A0ABQ7ZLE2_BRANA|nr:hypothetical protein HID58_068443 [Brassica napus]
MKEKSPATASTLGRILATCSKQLITRDYGSCVASKVPEVERDLCFKEFLALKNCMQHTSMSNRVSSSQPSVGSGGLSHAYIQHPSLRCNIPESRGLFYDDANRLLISTTSSQDFSWQTSPFNPDASPSVDSICEGPIWAVLSVLTEYFCMLMPPFAMQIHGLGVSPILSIRFSIDKKVIAVQRSDCEIQFFHRETKQILNHKCRAGSESILGFFWSDSPLCDLAIVKTSGMDLFACDSMLNLCLVETKKVNVNWYIYTHETRLVLLASGLQCKTVTGFQLSTAGVVLLPRFEMTMARSESNSQTILYVSFWFSSPPKNFSSFTLCSWRVILYHSLSAMAEYIAYKWTGRLCNSIHTQGSLPMYSSKLSVSVVDNLLLVHQIEAKVVIIYDLFMDSRAPVSAPLPLLWRGHQGSDTSSLAANKEIESPESSTSSENIVMYEDAWTFLAPDLILDQTNKVLCRAISASSSDSTSLLEFLQRRKLEANKAKRLCLGIARDVILERRPATQVTQAIDVLVKAYSYSALNAIKKLQYRNPFFPLEDNERHSPSGSSIDEEVEMNLPSDSNENMFCADEQQGSQLSSPAISPDELYKFVFASVEEMMVDESDYLVAIVTEFLRSISAGKLKVDLNIYIIEPSKEVALQLLESGRQNPRVRKLGLDMLRQLSLYHDYISSLVQDGYYLEALRYAQKHKVTSVRSSLVLEAAFASNDMQHLAAILRDLKKLPNITHDMVFLMRPVPQLLSEINISYHIYFRRSALLPLKRLSSSMALIVTAPPSRFRPPPDPPPRKSPPLEAPSPIDPPEPSDPPDISLLLALPRNLISSSGPSLQALARILDLKLPLPWMVSKISGGGVPLVSTGDSTFVYRRLLRVLLVCVNLELRTIALADDVLMNLTSVGSTVVLFGGLFVASMRSLTAVCSLAVVCSPLLSLFPIFPLVWSELDEQASLVLQGSSSQRLLSSAFGAVCVVLWVTLDVIFQEAFETVVMRILMVPCYDLYRHPIVYFTSSLVCLALCSFVVSSFEGV